MFIVTIILRDGRQSTWLECFKSMREYEASCYLLSHDSNHKIKLNFNGAKVHQPHDSIFSHILRTFG